jgi:peroxiredoxin (alkyl hydroperoxide reductase subunit C)
MAIIAAGSPVPDFVLKNAEGEDVTPATLAGTTAILVFYPFAFSPVCTDQLQIYEEVLPQLNEQGVHLYGVSVDSPYAQRAFAESLGVTIPQLSDFEPKGAASKAFGAYFEPAGMSNRALVLLNPDGTIGWSYEADNPGELPGANLLFDGIAAAAA